MSITQFLDRLKRLFILADANQNRHLFDIKCCAVLFTITYVIEVFVDNLNTALEVLEVDEEKEIGKNQTKTVVITVGVNCRSQNNGNKIITDFDSKDRSVTGDADVGEKNENVNTDRINHDGVEGEKEKKRVNHSRISKAVYSFLPLFSISSLFKASLRIGEKFHFYRLKLLSVLQGNMVQKFRLFCCDNDNEDFTDLDDNSVFRSDACHSTCVSERDLGSDK